MAKIMLLMSVLLFIILSSISYSRSPVGVMVPSEPTIEKTQKSIKKKSIPDAEREVDVLFTLMYPADYLGEDMDLPQMFAVIINGDGQIERKDILGDIQQIKYLNKMAWGANVAADIPGLYQFIMESKPWWDKNTKNFIQHHVKVQLPVLGKDDGWSIPLGNSLEIVPLTRPFGLTAPAIFSGVILKDGKPCKNIPVYAGYINSRKKTFPSSWHKEQETISNGEGQFTFLLNSPGWWYCEADVETDLLKGPDGENSPVIKSAIFWLYVDEYTDGNKQSRR